MRVWEEERERMRITVAEEGEYGRSRERMRVWEEERNEMVAEGEGKDE